MQFLDATNLPYVAEVRVHLKQAGWPAEVIAITPTDKVPLFFNHLPKFTTKFLVYSPVGLEIFLKLLESLVGQRFVLKEETSTMVTHQREDYYNQNRGM